MVKSRVAVLGTLAELHKEPIKYNLACLTRLVKELEPDLLCAEIQRDDWESGDLSRAPIEYREALVPLSRRTDIVIVPVSSSEGCELIAPQEGPFLGLRSRLIGILNWHLRVMQRLAGRPRATNSGLFGHLCNTICALQAWLCGAVTRRAWEEANQQIFDNILWAVRRDPGRRVLVTVDCRRRHLLEERLRHMDELELVDFWKL